MTTLQTRLRASPIAALVQPYESIGLLRFHIDKQESIHFAQVVGLAVEDHFAARIGIARIPKQKLVDHRPDLLSRVWWAAGHPLIRDSVHHIDARVPLHE